MAGIEPGHFSFARHTCCTLISSVVSPCFTGKQNDILEKKEALLACTLVLKPPSAISCVTLSHSLDLSVSYMERGSNNASCLVKTM